MIVNLSYRYHHWAALAEYSVLTVATHCPQTQYSRARVEAGQSVTFSENFRPMAPVLKPPPRRPSALSESREAPASTSPPSPTLATPRLATPPRAKPPHSRSKPSVEDAVDSLRSFVRSQVAVTNRMKRLRPPPRRDEIRAHTRRVSSQVRRIASNLDEKAYEAAVEQQVARPIAAAGTVSELETAIAGGLRFCEGKSEASAEANLHGAAVKAVGSDVITAVEKLWQLDVNRLTPGVDYEIDLQGRSRGYEHDAAPGPLFSSVADRVWSIPTFKTFYPLLSHYTAETGVEEVVGRSEIDAQRAFLREVCRTPCMRFAHAWLVANNKIRVRDMSEMEEMLAEMWFGLYRRDGCRDSSAFEHVFAGEVDDGKVKGMHSFLQLYKEEQAGELDYYGFLLPRPRPNSMTTPSDLSHLLTIRFSWRGVTKAASSVLFGVSPEFELAMYTMLFVAGEQVNELRLGQYRARVKVYQMGNKIGSAYPEALAPTKEEEADDAVLIVQSAWRRRREEEAFETRKSDDPKLGQKVQELVKLGAKCGKLFGLW